MERSLKHELWLLQNKLPQAWEFITQIYGCCPPDSDDFNEDEKDAICFGGCDLCWKMYFENEKTLIYGCSARKTGHLLHWI